MKRKRLKEGGEEVRSIRGRLMNLNGGYYGRNKSAVRGWDTNPDVYGAHCVRWVEIPKLVLILDEVGPMIRALVDGEPVWFESYMCEEIVL